MMWEEILRNAGQILQAVSIAVTAGFAIAGLNAWRRQLIGKRRIEIAEDTLVAAYKAKDAMSYIRSSGAFPGEGSTRPRTEGEDEANDLSQAKDTYFVPLERIHRTSEDFAALQKARLLCVVHFGAEVAEPFDEILRARHSVTIAARMLVGMVGTLGVAHQRAFMEQMKERIWEGYGCAGDVEKDPISTSVGAAVGKIEALCRRHLKA